MIALLSSTFAGESWMTDYAAAKEKARAENKPLLIDFTGSDWCPPCMHLEEKVLSQDAFLEYAADAYVILKLDFPRRAKQSAELKEQNEAAAEKYEITGFPTILILSPGGKTLDKTVGINGTMRSPETFVKHLKRVANFDS